MTYLRVQLDFFKKLTKETERLIMADLIIILIMAVVQNTKTSFLLSEC